MTNRAPASLPADYFAALYAASPDPWDFAGSDYERAKYAATLAALPRSRYRHALEVGCSIGVLTRLLAGRCDRVLALDAAEAALAAARNRCTGLPGVAFRRMMVPGEWPEVGSFDLILLSEVVYYLDRPDVARLAGRVRHALAPDGAVVLVHWTGPTDYPLSGDAAADAFIASAGFLAVSRQERAARYRLDVLQRPG